MGKAVHLFSAEVIFEVFGEFLRFWVEVRRFKVKGSWLAHIFPNQDSLGFNL